MFQTTSPLRGWKRFLGLGSHRRFLPWFQTTSPLRGWKRFNIEIHDPELVIVSDHFPAKGMETMSKEKYFFLLLVSDHFPAKGMETSIAHVLLICKYLKRVSDHFPAKGMETDRQAEMIRWVHRFRPLPR